MSSKILIGIIACNQKSKTLVCLESLEKSEFQDFEVFLVDNGSGEGIAESAQRFSFIKTHIEPTNLGASAGRNIILHYFLKSNWPYLLFLDNDMIIPPQTLEAAVSAAQGLQSRGRRLGGVGAHIVYQDQPEKYWSAGGGLVDWENAWFRETGQGGRNGIDFGESRRVETIPTAFLLATREAIQKVGEFAEDYFFYFEDADWCWRMIEAGFELWSAPEAVALHDESSAVGKCSARFHYLRTRNRLWFFQRFSPEGADSIRWKIFKSVFWNTAYPEFRDGRIKEAAAVLSGFLAGFYLPKTLQPSSKSKTLNPKETGANAPALR